MGERRRHTGTFEVERTTGTHEVLDRLFVYGTLRHSQTARSLIANQITGAEPATTSGQIFAFPMGYPAFVEDEPGIVHGEVLWLTELAATFGLLDAYEGTDFVRMIRQVTLETGEQCWAWIYVLADPQTAKLGTRIEDGDWVRYWTESES
ncbi:MAG TPA: gamma-glutamylcyclotransferase family protein [Kofleriaceae bacterium]